MPAEIEITGTMRAYSKAVMDTIEARLTAIAQASADCNQCRVEVIADWSFTPLINLAEQTDIAVAAARATVGAEAVEPNVPPITAGEDFAYMMEQRPGAFMFIGNGKATDGKVHQVHTPMFNFNDAAIPYGVAYWAQLVQQELG